MNLAGYLPTEDLRRRMLPGDMGQDDDYDGEIAAIGSEVASMFDRITGRQLRYVANATHECEASQYTVVVPIYPIHTLHSITLISGSYETNVTTLPIGIQRGSGLVFFGISPGADSDVLRFIVSGGYWTHAHDGEAPLGVPMMPSDIMGAFVLQCRAIAEAEDLFRQRGARGAGSARTGFDLTNIEISPIARKVLNLYTAIQ